MKSIAQHEPPTNPDAQLVKWALARVLEIAQRQGIGAADFMQMLDSGMQISDFLNAVDTLADADYRVDYDTVN
jgi:hypothetical protein